MNEFSHSGSKNKKRSGTAADRRWSEDDWSDQIRAEVASSVRRGSTSEESADDHSSSGHKEPKAEDLLEANWAESFHRKLNDFDKSIGLSRPMAGKSERTGPPSRENPTRPAGPADPSSVENRQRGRDPGGQAANPDRQSAREGNLQPTTGPRHPDREGAGQPAKDERAGSQDRKLDDRSAIAPDSNDRQPPAGREEPARESGGDRAYRRLPTPLPRATAPTTVDDRGPVPAGYGPAVDYESPGNGSPEFDLRKYWRVFLKHRWLFIIAAVLGLSVGAARTLLTTPVYRAATTIQINRTIPNVSGVQGGEDLSDVEGGRNDEFYQTQYELLQSRSLAERVVKTMNLQDNAAFIVAAVRSPLANLKRLVFGAEAQSSASSTSQDVTARQDAAVGRVMGGLAVQPVRDSTIVKVSFDNPNPNLAQQIANGVADAFIQENLDRRYDTATYARQFLEEHLAELKQKLEESEKQLVAYADANNIVSPTEGQTLAQPDLQAANDALTKASSDRLRLQLLWDQVNKATGIGVPEVLEDQAIASLRAKKADLETTYQDKLKIFKPAFPDMQKLKAQMDEIDKQITAEVQLIKASIKSQYDTAVANEQALTQKVDGLKGDVTDFRNVNIQYTILKREVDTNRTLYEGLLQRYKDVGVAGGVGSNNVSIVDRATEAWMVAPDLKKNLVMSLMIAVLLAAAAAFAREQFDDTFKSPDDLEDGLGLPLLGIIPASRSAEAHAKALEKQQSAVTEAYRSLRTALQFSTSAGVPKTLLVTSSRAGEGKSTTSIMLARHYAQVGMKILLIDADLRKPTLHRYFKSDRGVGLTNCLTGSGVPAGVFQKTAQEGLTLLPSGPLPPNPAELIAGPKMAALLTTVAETFDLVIIDGPPVAGLADAPLLSSLAEGTLLVIDGAATRRNVVKAALKRLLLARAQVVGVAVNRLDIRRSGYGYDYGYDDNYYSYPGQNGKGGQERGGRRQDAVAMG